MFTFFCVWVLLLIPQNINKFLENLDNLYITLRTYTTHNMHNLVRILLCMYTCTLSPLKKAIDGQKLSQKELKTMSRLQYISHIVNIPDSRNVFACTCILHAHVTLLNRHPNSIKLLSLYKYNTMLPMICLSSSSYNIFVYFFTLSLKSLKNAILTLLTVVCILLPGEERP